MSMLLYSSPCIVLSISINVSCRQRLYSRIYTFLSLLIKLRKCVFVCLFVRVFLGHLESDWDTLWHKVGFYPWGGFNTKIYLIGALINQIISVNIFIRTIENSVFVSCRLHGNLARSQAVLLFDLTGVSTGVSPHRVERYTARALRHLPVFTYLGHLQKKGGQDFHTQKKTDCIFGISMVELEKISRADFQ